MIRLILGLVRRSDGDILSRGHAVHHRMDGNPNFPNPPFKLSDFKAALNAFALRAPKPSTTEVEKPSPKRKSNGQM